MPTQGELFEEAATVGTSTPATPATPLTPLTPHGSALGGAFRDRSGRGNHDPSPAPVWLQRMSLAILVLFCFYIGALLTVLPWSPRFWDGNGWLHAHPSLREVLMQGWARGVLSGFGLLDIWIGISELLHYRDYRR